MSIYVFLCGKLFLNILQALITPYCLYANITFVPLSDFHPRRKPKLAQHLTQKYIFKNNIYINICVYIYIFCLSVLHYVCWERLIYNAYFTLIYLYQNYNLCWTQEPKQIHQKSKLFSLSVVWVICIISVKYRHLAIFKCCGLGGRLKWKFSFVY